MREFMWMNASCFYLWILRSSSEHLFIEYVWETAYFMYKSLYVQISTSRYSKKYLKYSSIRMRSNHSKMFIYLKSLEIFCEEVNSYWSCEMPSWNFTKKALSRIFVRVFCLYFLRRHHNYFLWRNFESVWAQFLSGNISEK